MHRVAVASLIGAVALLAACTDTAPSSLPTASAAVAPTVPPEFGLTWGLVREVERPAGAFTIPSDLATAPTGPGTAGHPGHFRGQSILRDVAVDGDRLVAVGYTEFDGAWTADAWTSTDGRHWTLAAVDPRAGTFAVAVAARASGGFVAVGRAGAEPAAWTSPDGASWTRATIDRLDVGARAGEPERMTSIVATPSGLLAGGSAGPELGDRRARLWHSVDGTAWQPVADSEAFEGEEVVALAVDPDGSMLVLSRLGTGQRAIASVALVSADGEAWIRSDDPDLRGGLVASVVMGPRGWLAVGSDGDEREAVAWTSVDGRSWERVATEPSRTHFGEKVRMTDVLLTDRGFVAIGNFVGVQFGDGTSWRSTDGLAWQVAPLQAALGQGEPEAIVAWRDRLVMVGSRGAPDDYIPTAWISPNVP